MYGFNIFLKNVQFWSDFYCIDNKYLKFLYPKVTIPELCIYELTETILQSENIRKLQEVEREYKSSPGKFVDASYA